MTSVQEGRHALGGIVALAERSDGIAAGLLAPGVRAWLASPEQGLSAAIESVRGPEATAEAMGRLAPARLDVTAIVEGERSCWAELSVVGAGDPETCVAGLSYDAAGAVSRLVWLRAPLVPACEVEPDPGAPDGRPILQRYFSALMGSRFAEAAAHFTTDTLYSHPPYGAGTARVLFRGREALHRGLATERGASPARQIITAFWQRQGRVFVEGVIEGIPDGGTFFSTAQINPAGEIARYVAFYSAERIPPLEPKTELM